MDDRDVARRLTALREQGLIDDELARATSRNAGPALRPAGPRRYPVLVPALAAAAVAAVVTLFAVTATSDEGNTLGPVRTPLTYGDTPTAAPTTATATSSADPGSALQAYVDRDRGGVRAMVGTWVPQLSSKRVGLAADGIVYQEADIVRFHQAMLATRPSALLLRSEEYPSFATGGFYVTIEPVAFATGADALSWCVANGLGPDDCFARRIDVTGGSDGTAMYQH